MSAWSDLWIQGKCAYSVLNSGVIDMEVNSNMFSKKKREYENER